MSALRLRPTLLVVPLGMLVGHQVAYGLLHAQVGVGAPAHAHDHVGVLTALAAPLALAGVAGLARRTGRTQGLPGLVVLAGAQALAFGLMEMIERVVAGGQPGELVASPLLWLGVAAQIGMALALHLGVPVARRAACSLLLLVAVPEGTPVPAPAGPRPPFASQSPRPLATLRWLLRRGPPVLLGT